MNVSKKKLIVFFLLFGTKSVVCMNFQFNKRPSGKSICDWCLEVVDRRVKDAELNIIKKMNFSPSIIQHVKQTYTRNYFPTAEAIVQKYIYLARPIFRYNFILDIVRNICNRPSFKRFFGNTSLISCSYEEVPHLKIMTEKVGEIKLIIISGEGVSIIRSFACSFANYVVLNLDFIIRNTHYGDTLGCKIEQIIGHELGHLYFWHSFRRGILTKYYEVFSRISNKYTPKEFQRDFDELKRSTEIQADVFSMFNNILLVKQAIKAYGCCEFNEGGDPINHRFVRGISPMFDYHYDCALSMYNEMRREEESRPALFAPIVDSFHDEDYRDDDSMDVDSSKGGLFPSILDSMRDSHSHEDCNDDDDSMDVDSPEEGLFPSILDSIRDSHSHEDCNDDDDSMDVDSPEEGLFPSILNFI